MIVRRGTNRPDRVFAARWAQLPNAMDKLLQHVQASEYDRVVRALSAVSAALSNPDLDKANAEARIDLVLGVLRPLGLQCDDLPMLASSLCQLSDQAVAAGAEQDHTLDGLWIASSLRGADQ